MITVSPGYNLKSNCAIGAPSTDTRFEDKTDFTEFLDCPLRTSKRKSSNKHGLVTGNSLM